MLRRTVERDPAMRATEAEQAAAMRRMWATVILNATVEAARLAISAKLNGHHDGYLREVDNYRRWLSGSSGRLVLSLAGIDPTDRAVEQLVDRVRTGDTEFMLAYPGREPVGNRTPRYRKNRSVEE